ncbi:hypothetical protein D3C83_28430 [compost metagenome]
MSLRMRKSATASVTTSTIAAVASMPVLAASTPMSVAMASICARTRRGDSDSNRLTPTVFWAVTAVMALVP